MAKFLVFQLYGPMAAWGQVAVGEDRPSQNHPSKSSIIGLLAAAKGICRKNDAEHLKLDTNLGVAICVRSDGNLLRDFHTVQIPSGNQKFSNRRDQLVFDKLKLNTLLSKRDYRSDIYYHVAVWIANSESNLSLPELQSSLRNPCYSLYLGRKSCPIGLPLNPKTFSEVSLKLAFDRYLEDTGELFGLPKNSTSGYYWEPDKLEPVDLGMQPTMIYTRRDKIRSRERWQFSVRRECYCTSD